MRGKRGRGLLLQALLGALAALIVPAPSVFGGTMVDLTAAGTATGTIGDVIFTRDNTKPTGTGVFDPFLTIQSPGNQVTEQGYNTSGGLPLDDLRHHWNRDVQVGDLATVRINSKDYYVFELDANETGQGNNNKYLSLDNLRLYTSPTPSQTTPDPDKLGTLRYALNSLNDPLKDGGNWVKIDSSRNDITGQVTSGSGSADLLVYIPASYLAGAAKTDYLYFYNLDGAHFKADPSVGAQAGFEEWRFLAGPGVGAPDGGSTAALLGFALIGADWFRRKLSKG